MCNRDASDDGALERGSVVKIQISAFMMAVAISVATSVEAQGRQEAERELYAKIGNAFTIYKGDVNCEFLS